MIESILDCLLLRCALDNFQSYHDAGGNIDKGLYLASIVGLAIHHNLVRQAYVDVVVTMSVPRDHCLVGIELATKIESCGAVKAMATKILLSDAIC